jgi:hypothetical protein
MDWQLSGTTGTTPAILDGTTGPQVTLATVAEGPVSVLVTAPSLEGATTGRDLTVVSGAPDRPFAPICASVFGQAARSDGSMSGFALINLGFLGDATALIDRFSAMGATSGAPIAPSVGVQSGPVSSVATLLFEGLPGAEVHVLVDGDGLPGDLVSQTQTTFAGGTGVLPADLTHRYGPANCAPTIDPLAAAGTGDLDVDGDVDASDLGALMREWHQQGDSLQGDLNGDFVVDFADFQVLRDTFTG